MTADHQPTQPTSRRRAASRGTLRAIGRRPLLWPEAVRLGAAVTRRGWWRRPPFLPAPDARYVDWRVATAYGSSDADPDPEDVAAFLRWRTHLRRG